MSASVLNTSADYEYWKPIWEKCRDFSAGQDRVMSKGEQYLPRLEGQAPESYKKYLRSGYLYNATGRTRQGFIGMVMRKAPDVNVPDRLKPVIQDIDQEGTDINEFAEHLVREELTVARVGILVDYPNVDTSQMSQAEAERLNLRPYAVMYQAEDILHVRTERVQNVSKPVQIRLYETSEEPGENEFETVTVERVRVLELINVDGRPVYRQRVFVKHDKEWSEDTKQEYIPRVNGKPLEEIPFVFVGDEKFREPHILDLVNANLQHYIQTADHRAGLKWTTRPQPYVTGCSQDKAENVESIGTGSIWYFPESESQVGMLEYSGNGLSAMEKTLEQLKEEMATLGARMIAPEKRMAETAEAHSIKRQGENSALATVSKHVSTALTKVLEWCAYWLGVDGDVSVQLNTDFIPIEMTTAEIKDIWSTYLAGGLTLDDVMWNFEQGERVDPSMSREERIAALQTRNPAGLS